MLALSITHSFTGAYAYRGGRLYTKEGWMGDEGIEYIIKGAISAACPYSI